MKHGKQLTLLVPALILLAACQQQAPESASPSASQPSASASVAAPSVTHSAAPLLTVDPTSMTTCDPAAVATVRWNVTGHSGVNSIQIYVASGVREKLFLAAGVVGEAVTGPWTRPGTRFTLKDPASGKTLATVIVKGPLCK